MEVTISEYEKKAKQRFFENEELLKRLGLSNSQKNKHKPSNKSKTSTKSKHISFTRAQTKVKYSPEISITGTKTRMNYEQLRVSFPDVNTFNKKTKQFVFKIGDGIKYCMFPRIALNGEPEDELYVGIIKEIFVEEIETYQGIGIVLQPFLRGVHTAMGEYFKKHEHNSQEVFRTDEDSQCVYIERKSSFPSYHNEDDIIDICGPCNIKHIHEIPNLIDFLKDSSNFFYRKMAKSRFATFIDCGKWNLEEEIPNQQQRFAFERNENREIIRIQQQQHNLSSVIISIQDCIYVTSLSHSRKSPEKYHIAIVQKIYEEEEESGSEIEISTDEEERDSYSIEDKLIKRIRIGVYYFGRVDELSIQIQRECMLSFNDRSDYLPILSKHLVLTDNYEVIDIHRIVTSRKPQVHFVTYITHLPSYLALQDFYFFSYFYKKGNLVDVPSSTLLLFQNIASKCSTFTSRIIFNENGELVTCDKNQISCFDLFCGCGGLSFGFSETKMMEVKWALDRNYDSLKTFKRTHPNTHVYCADIKDLLSEIKSGNTPPHFPKPGEAKVLVSGPNCYEHSTQNRFKKAISPDSTTFSDAIDLLEYLSPIYFVFENVPGLLEDVIEGEEEEETEMIGYIISRTLKLNYQIRNRFNKNLTWFHGLAQSRKRLFFVGAKTGKELPSPPIPTHSSIFRNSSFSVKHEIMQIVKDLSLKVESAPQIHITVRDAIGDIPSISTTDQSNQYMSPPKSLFQYRMSNGSKRVTNHIIRNVSEENLMRIKMLTQGQDMNNLPEEMQFDYFRRMKTKYKSFGIFDRLAWDRHFRTITASVSIDRSSVIHPTDDRTLSVRECARAQGFPDDYIFFGSKTSQFRQIGNAVCPPVAFFIANSIIKEELKEAPILDFYFLPKGKRYFSSEEDTEKSILRLNYEEEILSDEEEQNLSNWSAISNEISNIEIVDWIDEEEEIETIEQEVEHSQEEQEDNCSDLDCTDCCSCFHCRESKFDYLYSKYLYQKTSERTWKWKTFMWKYSAFQRFRREKKKNSIQIATTSISNPPKTKRKLEEVVDLTKDDPNVPHQQQERKNKLWGKGGIMEKIKQARNNNS